MRNIRIRKTKVEEVDKVIELIRKSQKIMNQHGVFQWDDKYPSREHILNDIKNEGAYILQLNGQMVGTLAMLEAKFAGGDMVKVHEGKKIWMKDDENYMLIGRSTLCPSLRSQGIAELFLQEIIRMCRQRNKTSIRGLTDKNNIPILKLFAKFNFQSRGEVYNPTFNRYYIALEKILDESPKL